MGKIVAAQFDLERSIAELSRRFITIPGAVSDQLKTLASLERHIGSASPAELANLRSEVAASIAATASAVQDGKSAIADAVAASSLGLAGSAAAARQEVTNAMANMRQFDAYLHFSSAEDEAEYHRREAERRAYIEAELAKGTPQGALNANGAAIGQMLDAGAHGASDSPEFQNQLSRLTGTYRGTAAAIRAGGGSTTEADQRLANDVRETLRRRGKSDAEIDAMFAANGGDPLKVAEQAFAAPALAPAPTVAPSAAEPPKDDLSDAMAALRAAGVAPPPQVATTDPAHGLSTSNQARPVNAVG